MARQPEVYRFKPYNVGRWLVWGAHVFVTSEIAVRLNDVGPCP